MHTSTPPSPRNRPGHPYEFGIGVSFLAFIGYRWASSIIAESDVKVLENTGKLLLVTSAFTLALLLVDYLLSQWRLDTRTRSGLWAAAAFGPYAGLVAWEELAALAWSYTIGLSATIFFFVLFTPWKEPSVRKTRNLNWI